MAAIPGPVDLGVGLTVGLGVAQLHNVYRSVAPHPSDLRAADPSSTAHRQALMDADFVGGGVALGVGVVAYAFTRQPIMLLLTIGGFLLISAAHHAILASQPLQ